VETKLCMCDWIGPLVNLEIVNCMRGVAVGFERTSRDMGYYISTAGSSCFNLFAVRHICTRLTPSIISRSICDSFSQPVHTALAQHSLTTIVAPSGSVYSTQHVNTYSSFCICGGADIAFQILDLVHKYGVPSIIEGRCKIPILLL
jgi:hypothetical protein